MPPFLPRKRSTPLPSPRQPPTKKPRLADVLDGEGASNVEGSKSKAFSIDSGSDSDSSLSDVDSDQFEDVVTFTNSAPTGSSLQPGEDSDDEEIEWEDAAPSSTTKQPRREALADGPIQITFRKDDDEIDYGAMRSAAKKGPTRRERQTRIDTHKLHVQFLLWHNTVRNAWISDKKVQKVLLQQLPPQILQEIEKWKRASGLQKPEPEEKSTKTKDSKRKLKKGKNARNQRDWGNPSSRLEAGRPDMSHGDPLISLMKVLAAYWKKRFLIDAPGLRKRGYSTKQQLRRDIHSFRNEEHDPDRHGEKIPDLESFRKIAERCEGSRDVGAQLFTALVRGLGIEARLVASLQPSGYGWTKAEQMLPRKLLNDHESADPTTTQSDNKSKGARSSKSTNRQQSKQRQSGTQTSAINLDTDAEASASDSETDDGDSVVDVTASMPKQRQARYDRDLAYPIYWTEVISPITFKALPVSPLILDNPVASTPEVLSTFEPRGAKAEKTHQMIAYVIAHSSDGTAKDVTVRYLRKRVWPGKTKGYRYPIEKIPIYDKAGRIKRHEDYDWFKHVMSRYGRSTHMRTVTDDIEDSTDLMVAKPDKKEDAGIDTLQSLKTSQDFVLERFLRREEALKPDAKPDRMFVSGKGDNAKEEPVYRRADVERCLTAESWHKEGRRPKLGETSMKLVPVRAVTLTRKREAEEHERVTGEKQMQGLYAWDQTEWIIPEPIRDGVIPKNSYGNMDCFVPSMVPKGAVHIPLKGTVRICKKLEIDFAEAVTGFEFGNKRAVPVCTGVVVAKEHEKAVKEAWRVFNEEQRRKEETKKEKLVLDTWKKFVIGLRIRERVAAQYGDQLNLDDKPTGLRKEDPISIDEDEEQGTASTFVTEPGGFLSEDDNDEGGGGFLLPHEDDVSDTGELVMEDEAVAQPQKALPLSAVQYPTPASMTKKAEHDLQPGSLKIHRSDLEDASGSSSDTSREAQAVLEQPFARKSQSRPKKRSAINLSADDGRSEHVSLNSMHATGHLSTNGTDEDESSPENYTPRTTRRPRKAALPTGHDLSAKSTPQGKRKSDGRRRRGGRGDSGKTGQETPLTSSRQSRRQTRTALKSPYFESSD